MMMRSRSSCNLLMLCIWALLAAASMAAEGPRVFKVGDDFGWRVPLQNDTAVYSHWAAASMAAEGPRVFKVGDDFGWRVHIGDSLSFVYDKDSVMEVDKWGFYHCNGNDPITSFDNGNNTLNLDRSGLFYFISASNGHCTSGQRLIVEVIHIHHHDHHGIASMPPSMSPLSSSPTASAASSLLASLLPAPFAVIILLAIFCCQP